MQIHILASGSTGNAVFVELGGTRLLVDAGISCRRIERGLAEVGLRVGDLDAILVTHEHIDHIRGLDVLVRKHQVPVYARPATWEMVSFKDRLPGDCCQELGREMELGNIFLEAFTTSHDAVDPVGFCLYYRQIKWVIATDLGMVTDRVGQALNSADVMVLESNHDIEMLRNGPYPAFLKKRIRSPKGHLSNDDAAQALARNSWKTGAHVFLAHLSQKNNRVDIAEKTVVDVLCQRGCEVGHDLILHPTYPDRAVGLVK